jgi:DNA-binding transcriptional LysR family regulator
MELRHLRYFCTVASELHFTRAAERLGIAQPPLTQQIKILESELNVALFERTTRQVRLTAAGKVFFKHAQQILDQVKIASVLTRQAGDQQNDTLRIGFTESASFHEAVTGSIREFRQAQDLIGLELKESPSSTLVELVERDALDLAFVRPPFNRAGLRFFPLPNERMLVAINKDHPKAKARSVKLFSLKYEPFVMYPRDVGPGLADSVLTSCERAGFSPVIAQRTPQMSSTINLVAAGLGISIVPECMKETRKDLVNYIRIIGEQPAAALAVVTRERGQKQSIRDFLALPTFSVQSQVRS